MKTIKTVVIAAICLSAFINNRAWGLAQSDKADVVKGNNKFAMELYQKLQSRQGNLFLSPYSISTALAMTYAGARGETEKQMASTLCFPTVGFASSEKPMTNERFHREFGSIISRMNKAGKKGDYELVVANALWGQKGYEFLDEFLGLVRKNYDGELQQVDFIGQTEQARKTINGWVEDKTKDKIKELIKKGMLDMMTRLVLTNAIYFKGKWASEFKPERTSDTPFSLVGGKKVTVPMMNQKAEFGYKDTGAIQILEMPYVSEELSMVILLPKKIDGIKQLEKELTSEALAGWLGGIGEREVEVYFPKFKMTSEFELSRILVSMGMPAAFSNEADFSGMAGDKDLAISAVIHKAYVDVNEEGTEAAAATAVVIRATGVREPLIFRADHPFFFVIRDNVNGSILFMGRMTEPDSN